MPQDGYVLNLLVSIDCLGNALTGGDPNETISSRAGKAMQEGDKWGCILCYILQHSLIFAKDHCIKAIQRHAGNLAVIKDD
ncbi:MAG: hypothetical protein KGI54_15455 [Pseudomonadota bacterium]|nr:hypothetical protein [Pseudomonadota bacterium]